MADNATDEAEVTGAGSYQGAEGAGDLGASMADSDDEHSNNAMPDGLDEEAVLRDLTSNVRDQDDLERDITYQANLTLIEAEDKKDDKRIERLRANIRNFQSQKDVQELKFRRAIGKPEVKAKIRQEIARLDSEIEFATKDIVDFQSRIEQRHQSQTDGTDLAHGGSKKMPNESHREFLIRTGKITPFANIGGPRPAGVQGELANVLVDAEEEAVAEELEETNANAPRSHQNLRAPGFADAEAEDLNAVTAAARSEFSLRSRKPAPSRKKRRIDPSGDSSDEYTPAAQASRTAAPDDFIDDGESEDDYDLTERPRKKPARAAKGQGDGKINISQIDDGNENNYQSRLADWSERRSRARVQQHLKDGDHAAAAASASTDQEPEEYMPHPEEPDHPLEYGLKLPGDIYPALFDYQKVGVQWLAELWNQKVGGIVGDEMGLGKTVQVISFIAALHYSKQLTGPVIVVAPATVMTQWVNEFHRWWPPMRVSILHSSGSGMVNVKNEDRLVENELRWGDNRNAQKTSSPAAKKIVDRVVKHGHVLVTTYAGLQTYGDLLVPVQWAYAVLDEGHKIRNPETAITIYCKELQTPNRIILSGTPVQNNLQELWSLIDFIFPMRLGTLMDFKREFEVHIKLGGYGNATNLQIMTAEKCAQTLKDTISPYILQRLKVDVAADLPKKTEQVLFCKLTLPQREAYEQFLGSGEMEAIFKRSRQALYGIGHLRKICNHPDLTNERLKHQPGYKWGAANKSGKMQVVKALLQTWKKYGHKTLLFCQGPQMLDILEAFVQRQGGVRFLRMDGKTPIKERQTLVDRFNNNPEIELFLLSTKVGGLGLNLTGANRVIIYDPDWNPSTDVQARERAWRLGQKREVVIYRLMSAGTIEEKIYHRQVYKQFLSNKVLKDPTQRTGFANHDLHDLFSLGSANEDQTETGKLFQGSEVKFGPASAGNGEAGLATSASSGPLTVNTNGKGKGKATADGAGEEEVATADDEAELRNIEGVNSTELYRDDDEDKPALTEEARMMEGIFARSGVHSALEHENIINSSGKPQANRAMLQREADRVANQAALLLRRSANQARNIPIGTVTPFDENSRARGGATFSLPTQSQGPSSVRRGRAGPSSSAVLAGLRDRQGLSAPSTPAGRSGGTSSGASSARGGTPTGAAPAPSVTMRMRDFERMIPDFIRRHGGQVPTKLLVDHFNQYCITSQQTDEFKAALGRVAKMEKKGGSLRGIWGLKANA
ncbi:uncharacterized protein JN550_005724 [Neoarthrinium moseri]|uniref:uncharacterized protein n=1 Tax=Neoarthrinium moseri TaxID=1658444 RepID=UPI001FDBB802|nr:uncharacterized protein JN550_005724 [Neoarthrinium moseri]KAI1869743.1 hypothetical protein JN550_005724 [Neoarthrinium moseri]